MEKCKFVRFEFPSGTIYPNEGKWNIDIDCEGGGHSYKFNIKCPISLKNATIIFNRTLKQHKRGIL